MLETRHRCRAALGAVLLLAACGPAEELTPDDCRPGELGDTHGVCRPICRADQDCGAAERCVAQLCQPGPGGAELDVGRTDGRDLVERRTESVGVRGAVAVQEAGDNSSAQASPGGAAISWSGRCDGCTPTAGCNLLGVGVESGTMQTCDEFGCGSTEVSRICRCEATSCPHERSVYAMADLLAQAERGDPVVRSGALNPGVTGVVFWQIDQTGFSAPTWNVSEKTGFAAVESLARSPSSSPVASAVQLGHHAVGLWLNSCSRGISARSEIQPLVIHHDFAAPVRPFAPSPPAPPGSPQNPTVGRLPQLDWPELAFRLTATVPTLRTTGAAVAYAAAVLRFRDASKPPPVGQPPHYYDFWVSVQLVDSRGIPVPEGVIGDSCAACSGLPIVITAPSGYPTPPRFIHRWPGSADFAGQAFAEARTFDLRISQDEFQRMLDAVVASSPRAYSRDPADYQLVHWNLNPEVYDPSLATAACDPLADPDVGEIGMTVEQLSISQVSWSGIPHLLYRGANASPQWGMQIFFTTDADPLWDEPKSLFAPLPPTGGTYDLRFNTLANPGWRGEITGLRVDPFDGQPGYFNIDRLAVYGLAGESDLVWAEECRDPRPFAGAWQLHAIDRLWSDQQVEEGAGYWGGGTTGIDPLFVIDLTPAGGFASGR